MTSNRNVQRSWADYYRLRNRARLGLLGFAVAVWLLAIPIGLLPVRAWVMMALFFCAIGIVAVVCAVPLFKWGNWRCPRCGQKFAEPTLAFGGFYLLIPVLWRLAFDSSCGTCKLTCGTPVTETLEI